MGNVINKMDFQKFKLSLRSCVYIELLTGDTCVYNILPSLRYKTWSHLDAQKPGAVAIVSDADARVARDDVVANG